MKKKVYREKYGINHDGSNFGNKKIKKDTEQIIKVKSKDKKGVK